MHAFDLAEFIQNVTLVTELFRLQAKLGEFESELCGRKLKKGVRWEMGLTGRPKVTL